MKRTRANRVKLVAIPAIALGNGLGLAACSGSFGSAGSAGSPAAVTCTFGATGADVQVQIANDATPCGQQESALATDGQSWYPISALTSPGSPGSADNEAVAVICTLSKNSSTMTVEDSGGAFWGGEVCSGEEQDGWTQ